MLPEDRPPGKCLSFLENSPVENTPPQKIAVVEKKFPNLRVLFDFFLVSLKTMDREKREIYTPKVS